MGHLFLLIATATAICGWLVGRFKFGKQAQLWIKVGVIPACVWLAFYFKVELDRVQPTLFSPDAQASIWTVMFIAGGIIALLSHPRPVKPIDHTHDGGALSA